MSERTNPNDLSVTVIGCSGTYSSADSACSSYLVRSATTTVLLDAGPGSSMELQRQTGFDQIDAIVLSHEHPDHWTEMPSMYHAYRYVLETSDLPVFGTAGTRVRLDAAVPEATRGTFAWTTIDATSTLQIGDLSLTFSETDHPVETLAMRIESGGASIAYSADTGPDWSPENFGAPIDLFLYETTLPADLDQSGIPHVSGRQAGERATAAGIGTVVLTHVPPGHDPADRRAELGETFSGTIGIAAPGRTFRPS